MRNFTLSIFLLATSICWSAPPPLYPEGKCGMFKVKGEVKFLNNKMVLSVFPNSMSETQLTLTGPLKNSLAYPHINKNVEVLGQIIKPVEKYRGMLEVKSLLSLPFDPLAPYQGHGFRLLKTSACKSKF